MRTTIFPILVGACAKTAFATTPPGCLLHAVNTQNEPSDLSAVCGNGAQDVQSYIADNCGTFEETAQKAFIDTCSSAGTSIAVYTTTATSASSTSSSSSTENTSTTAQMSGSDSASASSVSSTAGANVDYRQPAMGPMAAAVVAMVGAVAAL